MLRRRPFVGSGLERPGPTAWTRDEIGSLCVDAAPSPVPRPPSPVSRIRPPYPVPVPAPVSCTHRAGDLDNPLRYGESPPISG